MDNFFDGKNAICNICGNIWACTEREASRRCSKCEFMLDTHPDVWDWVFGVIKTKLERHIENYHTRER